MNGDVQDGEGVDIGKKHKLGHLRVDTQGHATFKRLPTNELVDALQLGIQYSVGGLEARPARDVLIQDFGVVEIIHFPKGGRTTPKATPPHRFNDFIIRSYAPVAFRHFREKFNIRPEDYLSSICKPLRELKNPGASGSLFYLTSDDEFIIKTVQKKEAEFLKTLLPGYYMNVTQNQRTLLPKFYGLYCYQGDNKNIRITVMNNLIPSNVQMHEKYDLKGSKFKRRANSEERQKEYPTWKDLDFMERHPDGLILEQETFNALKQTVERDCRVLESFHIMDYSFLIGIHRDELPGEQPTTINRQTSTNSKRMMYTPSMNNIRKEYVEDNETNNHQATIGGIPARSATGEKLSLYVGIIDILQSYQLRKKLEHTFKSVVTDGSQISVTNPSFYSERFQRFLFDTVFRKGPPKVTRQISTTEHRSHGATTPKSNPRPSVKATHLNDTNSTSSTETTNSRITSYYTSLRSSRNSENSATLYASSHQSDSLYNQPTRRQSPKIITTSFNNEDASKVRSYRDLTTPPINHREKRQHLLPVGGGVVGKLTSSTTNLSHRNNISDYSSIRYQRDHQSSDEVTRL